MPRRRLKPEERREEIIQAALRSFTAQPYTEVSMGEIAKEAGASRALLTHYFGDKEALYAAVIAYIVEHLESQVRLDLGLQGRDLIDANLNSMLDLVESHRAAALVIFGGAPTGRDMVVSGAVRELNQHLVARILTNHFGDREVPPRTRLAVFGFVGFASAAIFEWLKEETIPRSQFHELLADNIERALAQDRKD